MNPFRKYWDLLSRYIRPQTRRFALLSGLLLFSITLQVVNPQIMRYFIDTALSSGTDQKLLLAAAFFIGIALLQQGVSISVTYLGENVAWTATNALRAELARHCLNLDMDFHNAHTPGELIERIDGDVTELATFFSQFVITLVGNGLLMVGIVLALFREDWVAGLAFALFSVAALALLNRVRDIAVGHQKARRQAEADLVGFVEEQLNGTEDIRASGAIEHAMRGLHTHSRTLLEKQRKAQIIGGIAWNTTTVFLLFSLAAAMGLGGLLFLDGRITLGTLYIIFNYTSLLRTPIEQISRQMQDLQQAAAGIARIADLLSTRSTLVDGPGVPIPGGMPAAVGLTVEFDRVSFGYIAEEPVLRDVTFTLRPGEVLGLLGRTGSGKTTITRLLFRLYDPTAGVIRLGGVDLRAAHIADVRRHVGVVTQDIQLFHASVRDNLTFFDAAIPDARVIQVLADLGLDDWLARLPRGLDTKLAPRAAGLSAGEAQLLAFARVFLCDPGLVILDEASSRLDPATERRLEHAITRLLAGRTGIIIAHRLGTVQRADTILVLEDGRCQEYGPRAALERDPASRFAGLLRSAGLEEVPA